MMKNSDIIVGARVQSDGLSRVEGAFSVISEVEGERVRLTREDSRYLSVTLTRDQVRFYYHVA